MTQRSREDVIKQDVADLHRLGYAQELFRSMGGFSNFAISFTIISILTGAVILYNYGLALGGPGAVGIGWPLVTVFTLLIAASMAEIASAYPTAGGLYYWASRLRNKNWGWWTAWLNLGGQISIVAGINYAAAFYLGATILRPLFGFDPNAETAGLTNAIWLTGLLMLIEIGFNVAGTKIVATMNDISVWWHIGFVIAIAVACSRSAHSRCIRSTSCSRSLPPARTPTAGLGGRDPVRDRRRLRPEPAPVAMDVHGLRRVGPCRRGDGPGPDRVRVGRVPVGRGVGDLRLHRPRRADPEDDRPADVLANSPAAAASPTSSKRTWARG